MLKALKSWFKKQRERREAEQERVYEKVRMGLDKINAMIDEYEKETSLTNLIL
jgi:hypothetical protein